jgi:hypothetical protein
MSDFQRIDKLIRDAHVQRSAAIGAAIGDFLASSWFGAVWVARKATSALAPAARSARATRAAKTLPFPSR